MKNPKSSLLIVMLTLSSTAFAQAPPFDPDVDDVAPLPGIMFAIIAAVGIGIVKLRAKK